MALIAVIIAVLNTLFAVLSSVINITFQMLSIWAFKGPYSADVSILVGAKYAFYLIYDIDFMRYVSGVVGLSFGFYVKYQFDKKHDFENRIREVQQLL